MTENGTKPNANAPSADPGALSPPEEGLLLGEVQAALSVLPKSAGSLEERRQIARLRTHLQLSEDTQAALGIDEQGRVRSPSAAAAYRHESVTDEQKDVLRDSIRLWVEERFRKELWTERALWLLMRRLGMLEEALQVCETRGCYPTGAWLDAALQAST